MLLTMQTAYYNPYCKFSAIISKNKNRQNMRPRNTVSNTFTISINVHASLILSMLVNQFLNGIVPCICSKSVRFFTHTANFDHKHITSYQI